MGRRLHDVQHPLSLIEVFLVVLLLTCRYERVESFVQPSKSRPSTATHRWIGGVPLATTTTTRKTTVSSTTRTTETTTTSTATTPTTTSSNTKSSKGIFLPSSTARFPWQRLSTILSILVRELITPILFSYASTSTLTTHLTQSTYNNNSTAQQQQRTTVVIADAITATFEALGPTYVKFGQALSARSDVLPRSICTALAARLHSDMAVTMDDATARHILVEEWWGGEMQQQQNDDETATSTMDLDSLQCVAAASIGQVYSVTCATPATALPRKSSDGQQPPPPVNNNNTQKYAIKIQRPEAAATVAADYRLWLGAARILTYFTPTDLVAAVHEFMARLHEELDYRQEVVNLQAFYRMYHSTTGTCPLPGVVIPQAIPQWCTDRVICMEWLEGTKLTDSTSSSSSSDGDAAGMAAFASTTATTTAQDDRRENLAILAAARTATLTQLFDTGLMHADPHGGNLLKVVEAPSSNNNKRHGDKTTPTIQLGYLDFGIVSRIDEPIRDALMCSVIEMVLFQDVEAVVDLFGELAIVKVDVLERDREALVEAMTQVLAQVFVYPNGTEGLDPAQQQPGHDTTPILLPELRFDTLLGELVLLVSRFQFELPPYFINNARALATLEGLTQQIDATHNTMTAIYPFCLRRLFRNPSQSPIVERTLWKVLRDPSTGRIISRARQQQLLRNISVLTGVSRRKLVWDILRTTGGRALARQVVREKRQERREDRRNRRLQQQQQQRQNNAY